MAQTIVHECECGKRLRVPVSKIGESAKCPGCGVVFKIQGSTTPTSEAAVSPEASAGESALNPQTKETSAVSPSRSKRFGSAFSVSPLGIAAVGLGIAALVVSLPIIELAALLKLSAAVIALALAGLAISSSMKRGKSGIGLAGGGGGASVLALLYVLGGGASTGWGGGPSEEDIAKATEAAMIGDGAKIAGPDAPDATPWLPPKTQAVVGDFKVEVALVDKMYFAGSPDTFLNLPIQIRNKSKEYKAVYHTWRGTSPGAEGSVAILRDEFDMKGRLLDDKLLKELRIKGYIKTRPIYPKNFVQDRLVFLLPSADSTFFYLELPGKNLGMPTRIRMELELTDAGDSGSR